MRIPLSTNFYSAANKSLFQYYVAMFTLGIAIVALPLSVTICHAAIILYLVNWACEGNWRMKFSIIKGNVLIILILVLFVMEVFGTFYTAASGVSGVEKKVFFVLLPVALATSNIKLTIDDIYFIFYCFVASCLACSIVCLGNAWNQISLLSAGFSQSGNLSYLDGSDFRSLNADASDQWLSLSYIALANGIGIHPTYFSLYLAFGMTFLLFRLDENSLWLRTISWLLITYFSLFIILLSSRITIVGVLIILTIATFEATLKRGTRYRGVGLIVIVLLSCFLLYLNPVSRYRAIQETAFTSLDIQRNSTYMTSTQIRLSLWWLGLKASERVNPIWGTGTDDVYDAMKQTSDEYRITNSLGSYDPHNQFLFTLIGSGIIGLALLVALIACSLYFAFIHHDYLYAAFIFLFILLCITETALQLQKGIVFFAIFFSLLAFKRRNEVPIPSTLKAT